MPARSHRLARVRGVREPTLDAPAAYPHSPPFPRVLVGIDFSPASLAGCRWALAFIAPGADVLFSHVVPFEREAGDATDASLAPSGVTPLREIAPVMSGGLGGFAATLDIREARTAVRVGRPSHFLDLLAADFDASLIVVGRRQDAMRRRVGEANVVERLARRTTRPVLVVPEGHSTAPRCIVAALDEGPSAVDVLAAAAALATACGLPLIALHVLPPASGTYDRVPSARDRARGLAIRSGASDLPAAAGGQVTTAIGDPTREIIAAGVGHGGGLLVVGKRGADESPVGSLGSVARELLATSPLPVLAIDGAAVAPTPVAE